LGWGNVYTESMASRLLCFGTNGVTVFQGARIGISKQLRTSYASFSIGVHFFAYRINLATKTLYANLIFQNSKRLMQNSHEFINKSPKKLSEFFKLVDVIEIKGLWLLQNVATRWISLLELHWRILLNFIWKMHVD
jgi:hypothetical protein